LTLIGQVAEGTEPEGNDFLIEGIELAKGRDME